MIRRLTRAAREIFSRSLLAVWIVLPLFPVLGAALSWWVGVH